MVDVGDKAATQRSGGRRGARARSRRRRRGAARRGLRSPKGPVFDTAIVAGVMGAKRTHELIPFCHPLGLESCNIEIDLEGDDGGDPLHGQRAPQDRRRDGGADRRQHRGADHLRHVQGAVARHRHRRRRAWSPSRAARATHACARRRHERAAPASTGWCSPAGSSSRMQRDKAALTYRGRSQLERAVELLGRHVAPVFVSVRADQAERPRRGAHTPLIIDPARRRGPDGRHPLGIRGDTPDAAWLVLACDLPFLSDATLEQPDRARATRARTATAFRSAHDGLPEPLCAIWEPAQPRRSSPPRMPPARNCPRKFLINARREPDRAPRSARARQRQHAGRIPAPRSRALDACARR